jgi:PRC-barrel domain
MTERADVARIAACVLLAILLASASSAASAEGDAAEGSVTPADPPPAPPLGPGVAGEAHVPAETPRSPDAPVLAGGEEPAPALPEEHLRTIPTDEAAGILGKRVIGAAGEDVGMMVDVLIDSAGKPRAAVIDFGGFLGVGTRKIAVDWTFLQFRPGDRNAPVLLDVTADAIRAAPEYRPTDTDSSVVVSPSAEDPAGAVDEPADAGPGAPAAEEPAAVDGAPAPGDQERAQPPPPPAASGPGRTPLPEMKPPDGRPKAHPPAAGVPHADDLGPAPAPALPPTPPDARQ